MTQLYGCQARLEKGKEDMRMGVPSDFTARVSPRSRMGNRRTARGEKSAFGKYLDVDRQRQKMRELPPGRTLDSVYMQFMDGYRAWKSRQMETVLPDSRGWTEENLTFLRERYAGDLSAFEIYDALDAMEKLGILSEKGLHCAEGSAMVRLDMKGGVFQTSVDPDSDAAWLHGFDEAPMAGFRRLEDLLSWAKDFREDDWPDSITGAEAMARGWI